MLCAVTLVLVSLGFIQAGGDVASVKKLIVGKWETKEKFGDKEFVIHAMFAKDGALKVSLSIGDKDIEMKGPYKVIDEKIVEVTITGPDGKEKSEKNTIDEISKTKLVLTDDKGMKKTFTRVKKK
jgi:uncharacterized protein (TIGR03066 family)